MHVTGEPDGPPTSVGLPICDLGTGMWGAQGVLAALYERQRTGQGQKVECSLLETAVGFSSWTSAGWLADHAEPVRMGSRHRQNAPYQRFETKDGYMMIGAAGQSIWQRCARALGHPEWLEDPRFARSPERRKNRFALEKEITAVLATAPTAHWTKALDDAGVPCGPVYNYEQLFSDPQVQHREHGRPRRRRRAGPRASHPHPDPVVGERRGGAADRAEARPAQRGDPGRPRLQPGGHPGPARRERDLIFLIRHGETLGNASRTVQLPDNPLSPRGVAQAERLARRLEREGIGAILASDYARAAQTAERLGRITGLPVRHDPLLQERDFGDIRGTPYDQLGFDMFALDYAPPNGETWEVFHARVDRAWTLVQERAAATAGHLAVVTHGLVCRSLAARHLILPDGQEVPERWDNTAVTIIEHPAPWLVRLLNSSHASRRRHGRPAPLELRRGLRRRPWRC